MRDTVYVGFNRRSRKIEESKPSDDRTDEQLRAAECRRRIEMRNEERELQRSIGDIW